MIGRLGAPELIILLIVVLLLFGPGRIGKVAGEIGRSIKSFREGLSGDEDKPAETAKAESKDETK